MTAQIGSMNLMVVMDPTVELALTTKPSPDKVFPSASTALTASHSGNSDPEDGSYCLEPSDLGYHTDDGYEQD